MAAFFFHSQIALQKNQTNKKKRFAVNATKLYTFLPERSSQKGKRKKKKENSTSSSCK